MILKFFLLYVGAFFVCTIAFAMLAKNFAQSLSAAGKKPLLEGGLSAVGISGVGYLSTIFTKHLFTIFWIFTLLFLLFGIIHVVFFHRKYFYSSPQDRNKTIFAEILFMLALLFFIVVVFSSLEYFLENKEFLYFPTLMSMLAFFIPLSVQHTFEAAYKIPDTDFPTWQYPMFNPIELPDERPNEKILVIAFEAGKRASDRVKTNFRAKGPDTMLLGDLFYHFINDYNEFQSETPIEYANAESMAYEWGFRIKPKWYQPQRILNPELSMRENGIQENSIIICERI